jgi:hypothetical protein
MLYSYLPFLVHFLLLGVPTVELGYWSALLGFAYYLGALVGNLGWGGLADRVGRRFCLLAGVLGSGLMSLLFGFSTHFWVSIALRFVWGLMNTVGVGRTSLMEILDDSNSAQGMIFFSVVSGLGRIVGPLVGGLTSRPSLHYHIFRHTLFETFPFALPALLSFFWSSLIWLLSYFELEETLAPHRIKSVASLFSSSDSTSYSMLSDAAMEDNELDMSRSPDRSRCGVDKESSSSPFSSFASLSKQQSGENGRGDQLGGIELKSKQHDLSYGQDDDNEDNDRPSNSNGGESPESDAHLTGKKKGVTFNSYVQMKIIDTPDIRYKRLNKITEEDTPMYYLADEDNNYNRSRSYLEALQSNSGSAVLSNTFQGIDIDMDPSRGDIEYDMDIDASSRSLVSTDSSSNDVENDNDRIAKYTNGSELLLATQQEGSKDFRQLSMYGMLMVLVRSKLIYYTAWTYFMLILASSALNEVYPLWLVIPAASGGFGFSAPLLAMTLLCTGPASLALQLCAFPAAVQHHGLLPLIRACLLLFTIIAIVTPVFCIPALQMVTVLPRLLVILSYILMTVAADWALVVVYVFINNSCYQYQRATVNGFTQALACVAMMLASLGGSSFFALCESNSLKDQLPWPFHYAVVFWCIAIFANIARRSTYYLHRKIQKQRREPKFPRYAVQMEHYSIENETKYDNDNDEE